MVFGSKKNVTPITGGRDGRSNDSGAERVFQITYGKISRICLRIHSDRVKRTLMLYDPRSDDPDGFVRLRLPDGKLPGDDFLEEQRDGVLMHWAREDVDCYLDCVPLRHVHPDAAQDAGEGMPMQFRDPGVAAPPQQAASPPAQPDPPRQDAPAQPQPEVAASPATAQGQAQPQTTPQQQSPQTGGDENGKPKKKPDECATGKVTFMGVRDHTINGRTFSCYTVDLLRSDGLEETFRGALLQDRADKAGLHIGDRATISKWKGFRGAKNLFKVEKHS